MDKTFNKMDKEESGCSPMVRHHPSKVGDAGSNPVTRSKIKQ